MKNNTPDLIKLREINIYENENEPGEEMKEKNMDRQRNRTIKKYKNTDKIITDSYEMTMLKSCVRKRYALINVKYG